MSATAPKKLRVFFIPIFETSHVIPFTDLACLFAHHPGVEATMVVTPTNADLIRATIDRTVASGHQVNILTYPFPSVGLPPGVEKISSAAPSEAWRVVKATNMTQPNHEEILRLHRPDAVIADIPFWWTTDAAVELGIPRLMFHVGAFNQLVTYKLMDVAKRRSCSIVNSEEVISVPDLPGTPIRIPRSELPIFLEVPEQLSEGWNWEKIRGTQLRCHGVVVNTFYELEPEYCDYYRKFEARHAYCVGPIDLWSTTSFNSDGLVHRGGDASEEVRRCFQWLDTQKEASVVFVCFGSVCKLCSDEATQLRELAIGLEASGRSFVWVARTKENTAAWMPEGLEERIKGRGFIVRGWVPQAAILAHKSVGAFLTHCGWNSVIEAIGKGKPMLTWPLCSDQFIVERLLVEVVEIAARVFEGPRSMVEANREVVAADVIGKSILGFMEGEVGRKAMEHAKKYGAMAQSAVEGGSSRSDLDRLINDLFDARDGKGNLVSKFF